MKKSIGLLTLKAAVVIALLIVFASCKNKKKVTEVSDPQEIKAQLEKELSEDDAYDQEQDDHANNNQNRVAVKAPTKSAQLESYFAAISEASSTNAANSSMKEALSMFSSPEAPVLIVIYQTDGTTDYDEPTTIKRYFEYLKDTGKDVAQVEEMVMDGNGKIKELVLKK